LDTSLLVAAFTAEAATSRVDAWLKQLSLGDGVISDWVVAEFSAALSRKVRTGQISEGHRTSALGGFRHMTSKTFRTLSVDGTHFRVAARLADRYQLGLRAGDALHLAIVEGNGATLCTLDRRQSEAGNALGIAATLI
jgi:predicted nucleic acid-binding protein